MKILQSLVAIAALMLASQANASTVSHFHEAPKKAPAHRVSFIGNLFGPSETGETIWGNSRVEFPRKGRSYGRIFHLRSPQGVPGFFRDAANLKALFSGNYFSRDSFREWWLGRGEETTAITGDVNVPAIAVAPSAVPVPAAIWLFGSGLAALLAFTRRRQA